MEPRRHAPLRQPFRLPPSSNATSSFQSHLKLSLNPTAPLPEAASTASIASSSAIVPGISNAALFILLAILVIVSLGIWSWILVSYVPSCLSRRADHEEQRVRAEASLWAALLSALPIAAFPSADEENGTLTAIDVNLSSKEVPSMSDVEERQQVLALSSSTSPIAGVWSETTAVSSPPEESGNSAENEITLAPNEARLCISTEAHAQDKSSSLPALSLTVPPPPHNLHPSLPASTPIAPSPTSPLSVVIPQDMPHPLALADAAGSTSMSSSRPSYYRDNLPNERDDHPHNTHHYGELRPAGSYTNPTMNSQTDSAPTMLEWTSGNVDLEDVTVPSSPSLHHTTSMDETLSSFTEDLPAKCSKTSTCHDDADCGVIIPSPSSLSESISWDPELSRSIQCLGLWIEQQQAAKQSGESTPEDVKTIGLSIRSAYDDGAKRHQDAADGEDGQLQQYSKPLLEGSYYSLPAIKPYVAYNDTLYSLSTDSIDEDEEAIPRGNAISTLINHLYAGEPTWSSAAKTFGPVIVVDECESAADWSVSDDSICFSPMTPEGLEYLSELVLISQMERQPF
ncbi:uncharacterized protein LAESUDRAFT_810227 [Laetiporus sulphureus 93-53]|uniref:Uncharacterized protein n=1 Tax=Laetiporus sulphureus 93-53 TaxID=1314785 RepID=A0A165G6D9_9APHY|nr:uncharacterized protein LAESUDRAFT_810227 [Laetiporus sulphureus 93-53]KZT09888.1 hypothetical protein LAESUDRAFT_810227 [Laetiporus sulphureus 93-53]